MADGADHLRHSDFWGLMGWGDHEEQQEVVS